MGVVSCYSARRWYLVLLVVALLVAGCWLLELMGGGGGGGGSRKDGRQVGGRPGGMEDVWCGVMRCCVDFGTK
ncbi:hypothetical protein F4782DRAFT_71143 [Xylaria castorea]|nr:hypothetical protein F4782DRAFT_71143 [Xylaria castorea]